GVRRARGRNVSVGVGVGGGIPQNYRRYDCDSREYGASGGGAIIKAMGTTAKTLYDTDFVAWADETAALVRAGRLNELDLEHVAEEIEGLAGSDRRAVRSQLRRLVVYLIKQRN